MDPFSAGRALRPRAAKKAEFARFHDDNYPSLVALLHALHGDRAHAHRVARRAFADAWLRWERVRALPDPAAWTRRRARQVHPPRRARRAANHESEWIAPAARPIFDALSELPEEPRTVLALHHIGGLDQERIADEERLPPAEVAARLAYAGQALAARMGRPVAEEPGPIDPWLARELADLAHALSYRTDRRAVDQVFALAVRHRVGVAAATVAVVALAGLGGVYAVRQYVPTAPQVGSNGTALPPRPAPDTAPDTAPPPLGLPTAPATPPAPGSEAPAVPPVPPAPPALPVPSSVPSTPVPGASGSGSGGSAGSGRSQAGGQRDQGHEVGTTADGSRRVEAPSARPRSAPDRTRQPAETARPATPDTPPPPPPKSEPPAPSADDGQPNGQPNGQPSGRVDGGWSQSWLDGHGDPGRTSVGGGWSQSWPDGRGGRRETRVDGGWSQSWPDPGGGRSGGPDGGRGQGRGGGPGHGPGGPGGPR